MPQGTNGDRKPGISPADIFRAAVAAGNLTRDERIAHRCACALVAARDEQRREEARAQVEMEFAA